MSLLKLLLQPAIAYVLLYHVLRIDHEYARYGVLLAAMPSGINGYVFATYYNRVGQRRGQHDPDLDRAVDRDDHRLALRPEPLAATAPPRR